MGGVNRDETERSGPDAGPDWRVLYRMAAGDAQLRARIGRLVRTVPLPLPHFWLAALASLDEPVDWDAPVPGYYASTSI